MMKLPAVSPTEIYTTRTVFPQFSARTANPPENTPEKYKQAWDTLPDCCQNFYINPGTGCCAGLPEPNTKVMEVPVTLSLKPQADPLGKQAVSEGDNQETPQSKKKSRLSVLMSWFKHFFKFLWADFKLIFTGS